MMLQIPSDKLKYPYSRPDQIIAMGLGCDWGILLVTGETVTIHVVADGLDFTESGAIVFCSSSGKQYSFESREWNNGAFTKALIEGLSGKTDYHNTGRNTINILDLYISERVKKHTGGVQIPVTATISKV